ncbi:MAG: hypothetical protein ICV53_04520 [Flavisolibacter sp.]|nr:hypothetical protein [Flavisolibacter sp.]
MLSAFQVAAYEQGLAFVAGFGKRQPRTAADKCKNVDVYIFCSTAFGQPKLQTNSGQKLMLRSFSRHIAKLNVGSRVISAETNFRS